MRASRSSKFTWTWGTDEGLLASDVSPRHPHPPQTATIPDHSPHPFSSLYRCPALSRGYEWSGTMSAEEFQAHSSRSGLISLSPKAKNKSYHWAPVWDQRFTFMFSLHLPSNLEMQAIFTSIVKLKSSGRQNASPKVTLLLSYSVMI